MSERIYKRNVIGIFGTYLDTAAQLGYDVSEWNLRITSSPMLISAARGGKGPAAFEALPGLTANLGVSYRTAYDAITTATRTLRAILDDRPQTSARGLYEYRVGGRYGTHYVDMYYDIKRDGSYIEMMESALFQGSNKEMQRIVNRLHAAMHTDPTESAHHDSGSTYTTGKN